MKFKEGDRIIDMDSDSDSDVGYIKVLKPHTLPPSYTIKFDISERMDFPSRFIDEHYKLDTQYYRDKKLRDLLI